MIRPFANAWIALAFAAPLLAARVAAAQTALGEGNALDRNLQIGPDAPAGVNPMSAPPDYQRRNDVITGNVPGLEYFHGRAGYRAPGELQTRVSSDYLFRFRAQSVPVISPYHPVNESPGSIPTGRSLMSIYSPLAPGGAPPPTLGHANPWVLQGDSYNKPIVPTDARPDARRTSDPARALAEQPASIPPGSAIGSVEGSWLVPVPRSRAEASSAATPMQNLLEPAATYSPTFEEMFPTARPALTADAKLARSDLSSGRYAEAAERYRLLLVMSPNDIDATLGLVYAGVMRGGHKEAADSLAALLHAHPRAATRPPPALPPADALARACAALAVSLREKTDVPTAVLLAHVAHQAGDRALVGYALQQLSPAAPAWAARVKSVWLNAQP